MEFEFFLKRPIQNILNSSLFKSSGIYTISSVLNASIPFLLLPLLTKYLNKADFGIISIFGAVTSFIMPFVGINMEGAIARRYYADKENISKYTGNCVMVSIISFLLVFFICLIFRNVLYSSTSVPSSWILIGVLYCFSQFIILVLLTTYQVKIKPVNYGIIQISQSLLNFGFSFIMVVSLSMEWKGRLAGQVLSSLILAAVAAGILISKKYLVLKPDLNYIKNALKFGGGLIPHALGGSMIMLTNRFFLLHMVSIEEAGLYGVASQIASVIGFFTISFNNAYVPWLYNNLSREIFEIKKRIVRLTYLYFVAIVICGFMFYLVLPLIFKILIDPKFNESLKYCFWIIMGFVFQGMYFMVTNYISYSEKTYFQAFVTLGVGIITIPANYFFIKIFGSVGAAMVFSFAYFLLFLFTWIFSARVYSMPWFSNHLKLADK